MIIDMVAIDSFLGFMKEAHVHYELSYEHVLHRNYTTLASIIRPTLLTQLRQFSRSSFDILGRS